MTDIERDDAQDVDVEEQTAEDGVDPQESDALQSEDPVTARNTDPAAASEYERNQRAAGFA